MFPISNMPTVVQAITYVNPLKFFVEIIRGILLKGLGIGSLGIEFAVLAILGISTMLLAASRFKKTAA